MRARGEATDVTEVTEAVLLLLLLLFGMYRSKLRPEHQSTLVFQTLTNTNINRIDQNIKTQNKLILGKQYHISLHYMTILI